MYVLAQHWGMQLDGEQEGKVQLVKDLRGPAEKWGRSAWPCSPHRGPGVSRRLGPGRWELLPLGLPLGTALASRPWSARTRRRDAVEPRPLPGRSFMPTAVERVCIVTGGTGRLGSAVAKGLVGSYDRIIVLGRNEARGQALVESLREASRLAFHGL